MSTILQRGQGTETISVELLTGVDGQGAPAYDSPVDVTARVVREAEMVRLGDGSEVRSTVTVWADVAQPVIVEQARVTLADGFVGIALQVDELKRLDGVIDHRRVRLREEQG